MRTRPDPDANHIIHPHLFTTMTHRISYGFLRYLQDELELGPTVAMGLDEEQLWGAEGMVFWAQMEQEGWPGMEPSPKQEV